MLEFLNEFKKLSGINESHVDTEFNAKGKDGKTWIEGRVSYSGGSYHGTVYVTRDGKDLEQWHAGPSHPDDVKRWEASGHKFLDSSGNEVSKRDLVSKFDELKKKYNAVDIENESINESNGISLRDFLTPGSTDIWYMKPDAWQRRDIIMGYDWAAKHNSLPDPKSLGETHILLGSVDIQDPEEVFRTMQAERWAKDSRLSNDLIRSKGLAHTSMSVGDIMRIGNKVLMVDMTGFKEL